ncbi:MAG: hypothetical protein GY757_02150 [bacterium]|nr:hypothetical protein [bacterium]
MSNNELKMLIDDILNQKINVVHSRVEAATNTIIAQMEEIKEIGELSTYELPADIIARLTPPPEEPKEDRVDILHQYIKKVSAAVNQLNLINGFLEGVNNFCTRAALFLVREDKLVGWKGRGFSALGRGIGDEEIKKIFFSLSANTIFKYVLQRKQSYIGSPSSQPDDHLIYSRFGGDTPEKILTLPFFVKGKPQAVIYTDAFDGKELGRKEVEMLSTVGEMSLDLLPLRQKILSRIKTQEFPEDNEPAKKANTAPTPAPPPPAAAAPPPLAFPPHQTTPPPPVSNEKTVASIKQNDPERLARVIINDIILYNKQVVEDGRVHKNLYSVLQDTILQSRELYLNKFSDISAFEQQLITTLANGDREALKGYNFEAL